MNIICPIFPESSSEVDLLRVPFRGEPYVDYALRRLNSENDVRLKIVTDHKVLYEHFTFEGYNTFWADAAGDTKSDCGPFAHFKLSRLQKRLSEIPLGDIDELVLLDIRYPLLTYSVLNKALAQYRRSKKKTVVSISQPVDHPAQIDTFFIHVDTDILSMIDTRFNINRFVEDSMTRYGIWNLRQTEFRNSYRSTLLFGKSISGLYGLENG